MCNHGYGDRPVSGSWVATFPPSTQRLDSELVDELQAHDLVAAVKEHPIECYPGHVYALCKDPGGSGHEMLDVLRDVDEWKKGEARAVWAYFNDTSMLGDVTLYKYDDGLQACIEFSESSQRWSGRRAEACAVTQYGIDAVVNWWERFD